MTPVPGQPGWRRDERGELWYSAAWLHDRPAMLDPTWTPAAGYAHAGNLLRLLEGGKR